MTRFSVFCTAAISLLSVIFLLSFNEINAQEKKTDPAAKKGSIKGIVVDASTLQPLEGCNCSLVTSNDGKLISGISTGSSGMFELKNLPQGVFDLRVTYIGYKTLRITRIFLIKDKINIDLDTLRLHTSSYTANTVEITASREKIVYESDKVIFNLDKELQETGGSAFDVLEFAPMVSIGVDDKITMAGKSGVKIFIDGIDAKYLGFDNAEALRSFPSQDIESIEIITNPSAGYDTEGDKGVINIITRRNIIGSYGGSASAGLSTRNRYNSGLGVNYSYKDFASFLDYQSAYSIQKSDISSLRISSVQNKSSYLMQSNSTDDKMSSNSFRLNVRYKINKLSVVGSSASFRNSFSDNSWGGLNQYSSDGITYGSRMKSSRLSSINRNHFNWNFFYRTTSQDVKAVFDASASYMNNSMDNTGKINQLRQTDSIPYSDLPSLQENSSMNTNNSLALNARYSNSFEEFGKISTAYEGSFTGLSMKNNYLNYDFLDNFWRENLKDKADQAHDEQKHSVYFTWSKKIKDFRLDAGLRAEDFITRSTERISNSVNKFNYLCFLPSVQVNLNTGPGSYFASYSRRVNYPLNKQLNPQIDYSDSTNISSGNPALRPSFSNSYALTMNQNLDILKLLLGVAYVSSSDIIEQYTEMENLTTARTTFRNMSSQKYYGINALLMYFAPGGLHLDASAGIYRKQYRNSYLSRNSLIFTSKLSGRHSLGIFSFNGSLDYLSKNVTAQEETKGSIRLDLGLSARLMNKKLIVSLKANDPFNLVKRDSDRYGAGFVYKTNKREDTRIFTLSIRYSLQEIIKENEEVEEIIEYRDDF